MFWDIEDFSDFQYSFSSTNRAHRDLEQKAVSSRALDISTSIAGPTLPETSNTSIPVSKVNQVLDFLILFSNAGFDWEFSSRKLVQVNSAMHIFLLEGDMRVQNPWQLLGYAIIHLAHLEIMWEAHRNGAPSFSVSLPVYIHTWAIRHSDLGSRYENIYRVSTRGRTLVKSLSLVGSFSDSRVSV